MNDGSTDYKSHHVDSLAFGHCDFSYRNLGRPAKIQIKQLADSFEVVVDGRRCFGSDKVSNWPQKSKKGEADSRLQIKLPSGFYFGISAASADTPDSFEVYKFVTSSASGVTRENPRRDAPSQQPPQPASNPGGTTSDQQASSNAQFVVQFTDLQNRIQTLSQSLDNVLREVQQLGSKSEGRHQDLSQKVTSNEQLSSLDRRIQSIENTLQGHQAKFSNIQGALQQSHSTLNEGLTEQMTHRGFGFLIGIRPRLTNSHSHIHQITKDE